MAALRSGQSFLSLTLFPLDLDQLLLEQSLTDTRIPTDPQLLGSFVNVFQRRIVMCDLHTSHLGAYFNVLRIQQPWAELQSVHVNPQGPYSHSLR